MLLENRVVWEGGRRMEEDVASEASKYGVSVCCVGTWCSYEMKAEAIITEKSPKENVVMRKKEKNKWKEKNEKYKKNKKEGKKEKKRLKKEDKRE